LGINTAACSHRGKTLSFCVRLAAPEGNRERAAKRALRCDILHKPGLVVRQPWWVLAGPFVVAVAKSAPPTSPATKWAKMSFEYTKVKGYDFTKRALEAWVAWRFAGHEVVVRVKRIRVVSGRSRPTDKAIPGEGRRLQCLRPC